MYRPNIVLSWFAFFQFLHPDAITRSPVKVCPHIPYSSSMYVKMVWARFAVSDSDCVGPIQWNGISLNVRYPAQAAYSTYLTTRCSKNNPLTYPDCNSWITPLFSCKKIEASRTNRFSANATSVTPAKLSHVSTPTEWLSGMWMLRTFGVNKLRHRPWPSYCHRPRK